jgi:hypothetical protein
MFSSIWDEYINNLPLREKAYMVQSPNPLELLQLMVMKLWKYLEVMIIFYYMLLNNGSYPRNLKKF